MDDGESTSGMTFLSQSTKSPKDQMNTRRLHSWTMLRTWVNREIAKEIVSTVNSGGSFDTKGRFMFPPDTMTTDLLLEPSTYRRGAKMQSKFGASVLSDSKQQQLGNSTYFVYGIPRVRLSCISSDALTVDLNLDDIDEEDPQTTRDQPLRDSYLKKSLARTQREQTEYDEMKMRTSLGLSKKRIDTEYDDLQMRTTLAQSRRKEEEKENNPYGDSRLMKSQVSRETKQKDEEPFYFGGFGGKSRKEGQENDRRIGESQFRQSFRNDNELSSSSRPGREDARELKQSRRPLDERGASGIYSRQTRNPYLDDDREDSHELKQSRRPLDERGASGIYSRQTRNPYLDDVREDSRELKQSRRPEHESSGIYARQTRNPYLDDSEDSRELKQSRRPEHESSGIYARQTRNPYLDEEEPIYSTKITPRY